ncbi:MAG: glycosyltransferase family 39 protein [Anaerolineae bacterium]
MQTVLPIALIVINLVVAYPSATWLLSRSGGRNGLGLRLALTIGLSAGGLSQVMLWESLLGIPFDVALITISYFVIMLPGLLWWARQKQNYVQDKVEERDGRISRLALFIIVTVALAIFFNAVYWPFYQSDALGIYAAQASYLKTSRALIPLRYDNFSYYQAYPMLVQLNYAYVYLASGWENGYVAKVIPTLLSLACLPATFTLGTELYRRRVGWLAAVLLALTPAFARWGSSGYVDLPMALYYTLGVVFGWRLYKEKRDVDAALMGLMMGLAAWTKNAGLVSIVLMLGWLAFLLLTKQIGFKATWSAVVICGLIAAPWYIRNWVEAHLIMPDTAWTEQAGRTIGNLLVFIMKSENFGVNGWFITGGVPVALYEITIRRRAAMREILITFFSIPFFGLWWFLVSYDPRFLLLFLPILTIVGANLGVTIWNRSGSTHRRWVMLLVTCGAVVLMLLTVWNSIGFKDDILRHPLMDDAAKQAIVAAQRGG